MPIYNYKCEECGKKALINLVFVYHDMEKRFCVQCCPFERVKRKDKQLAEMYAIDVKLKYLDNFQPPEMMEYLLDPHIVLSLEEMVRYVQFRDLLYKQLIEELKRH